MGTESSGTKKIPLAKKKRTAFVCSGGAAKAGAFHLGVALALQEKGFKFVGGPADQPTVTDTPDTVELKKTAVLSRDINIYVGSSAGSIICTYLAAGYTLDQIFDSFLQRKVKDPNVKQLKRLAYTTMFSLRKDAGILETIGMLREGAKIPALSRFVQKIAKDSYENLFNWKWLKWSGFFSTAGLERYLREDVLPSNDFRALAPDLFIVATQLNHSRKVVFGKYKYSPPNDDRSVVYVNSTGISEACAASTALPLIYEPYAIKNERGAKIYYFDGEIRDTLSTHVGYDAGADLVIASYTHKPYHFLREVGSLHEHGMPAIMIQALYLMIERKIQATAEMNRRNEAALDAVSEFFKTNHLDESMRKSCLAIMEKQLGARKGVDCIYIHPKPTDNTMFFGDHFNLSSRNMSEIVRSGFRAAIDTLRKYELA